MRYIKTYEKYIKTSEHYGSQFKYSIGDYVLINDTHLGKVKAKIIDIHDFSIYCYVINKIYNDGTFSDNFYLPKSSIKRTLNKKEMLEIEYLVSANKYNL